jgi:hypothetical protein
MLDLIHNIPDIKEYPLKYVLENIQSIYNHDTIWLEFGVYKGDTINYISKFTKNTVYGFDSFEGLPEIWRERYGKGHFSTNGVLPEVNSNVILVKGWFDDTLPLFIANNKNKKISFIHIDCDLYSSTKYVLTYLKDYITDDCVIVFDELVNYDGFDGNNGELRALYEFLIENNIKYKWIGMNGCIGMKGGKHQHVAMKIVH